MFTAAMNSIKHLFADIYKKNNKPSCWAFDFQEIIPDSTLKIREMGDKKLWQAGSICLKHHPLLAGVGAAGKLLHGFC